MEWEKTDHMDVRYLVLILFLLSSCMPSPTVGTGAQTSSQTNSGSESGSGPTPLTPTALKWNYLGSLVTDITVNVSNLNNAYIVGTPVEEYLAADLEGRFTSTEYCAISTFSVGGFSNELRSRVVPISYYDFSAKRTVRNLRVDFSDLTNSQSHCSKTTKVQNSSGDYVVDPSTPTLASRIHFQPSSICSTCTSNLIATKVRLFRYDSSTTSLLEIPTNFIATSVLKLQVDPNYSVNGSAGTCTNSDCRQRGLDCCLENQCVKDGSTKPAARDQYQSLLETAEEERLQNPLAYLNYPQLYYICSQQIPSPTTAGAGSGGSYDAAFEQLKKDYYCVQNLKSQATLTPFHNEIMTKTYRPAADCLTAAGDSEEIFYYKNVMKRLYTTCGCNRTELAEMISNCPAYDYAVTTKDTQGNPARIDCYTPPTIVNQVPMEQSVSVSSRSAPHRFFDTSGVEKSPGDGNEQEGSRFEYLDDGKVLPSQSNFSMNAILGQMEVSLDKALPAKTVTVDVDQIYLISTTSGYYTPCPTCAKDSWLSSFTAFPSSTMGTGLQAIGYTTERDSLGSNTTAGNYEDTIFGRACWIPPTMIPFSHSAKSTTQAQRLNRLQTQAALFINGYQRDWFGFNKGALIGSFDGVTWFAIGKGRIVRSTSKKLFLAINAPFADLAAPTMHVVRVAAYDGITQAAQVDFDPQYTQYHPYQNEAANCQKYHLCSTDTDCITRLGWEYTCSDVKDLTSNLPEFDADAKELANTSKSATIEQILQQKRFPTGVTKRCVYRGSGAICHTNSGILPGTNEIELNKKRLLTCAPNFFCASAGSGGFHNNKISRFAAALDQIPVARNHLFGKDANILGRPLNYLGTDGLLSTVRQTLVDNLNDFEATLSSGMGVCQPGKGLPTLASQASMYDPFRQHMSVDSVRRADYISQIGSCNTTLFTNYRHTSCPVLNSSGNYEMFASGSVAADYYKRATNQNACGLESLHTNSSLGSSADQLQSYSPFRSIEARTLGSQIISDPTLARDACFRRAGSVCHTDLDCSPNKLHANQVDFFGKAFFGNDAEKSYWSEYLVCGQTDPKPLPSNTDAFKNYDMSLNRCCREVGKDLTTYTADVPTDTYVNATKPYDPVSKGLNMSVQPGVAPNDPLRYSRLAVVENIGSGTRPILSGNIDRTGNDLTGAVNVTTPNQWKTLSEANTKSCCGGGWVRKFADGSNDWSRRDRLVLDVNNFKCINSRTPLITTPEDLASEYGTNVATSLVQQDYGDYCKDGTNTNGACAQYSINNGTNEIVPTAGTPYNQITINTVVPDYTTSGNPDFYFQPRSGDENAGVTFDTSNDFSRNPNARTHINIKLPSYVNKSFETQYAAAAEGAIMPSFVIYLVRPDGVSLVCNKKSTYAPTSYKDVSGGIPNDFAVGLCYYSFDSSSRILKVGLNSFAWNNGSFNDKLVGLKMTFNTPGRSYINRQNPGSSLFYLKRLGRLDLSGIPQITFEMLTCNDNSNRILPGIFSVSKTTPGLFMDPAFSWKQTYSARASAAATTNSTITGYFTNQYGLQHDPVFSANDYKCCTPAGKTTTDVNKCCSGFGTGSSTTKTCALPGGTDLMVYYNRYVTNEGRGTDKPGGGLADADFDDITGEPKVIAAVSDKIRALGEAYCSSGKVRQGGAFGSYFIEPYGSDTKQSDKIFNIVDSSRDFGQLSNAGGSTATGYNAFMDGFRWNHHLYCED